jgi:hypothetical protein
MHSTSPTSSSGLQILLAIFRNSLTSKNALPVLTIFLPAGITERTNADGSTATAKYSGTKLQSTTDEEGRTTRFEWCPGCGGLQKLLALLNYVLQWERNDDFDVTAFADANKNTTNYRYRGLDDLKEVRYPDDTSITYTQSYPLKLLSRY